MVAAPGEPFTTSSSIPAPTRAAGFYDPHSDEDSTPTPRPPTSNGPVNGEASSNKRKVWDQNGGTPKKRGARSDDTEESRRKRRGEADRLYRDRQLLPFYKGGNLRILCVMQSHGVR